MIKTKFGYINYNYGNRGHKVRDEPKGAFGKGATRKRLNLAKDLNELGDMLSIEFPSSLEISIRGTSEFGIVFRIDNSGVWRASRDTFNMIVNLLGYNIVKENINHIYVKKR
jgi:hypothetical protein